MQCVAYNTGHVLIFESFKYLYYLKSVIRLYVNSSYRFEVKAHC